MPEDEDAPFAAFDLFGARFDADGMPTENLIELAHFRTAIYEVARQIWLESNSRARVPRNFAAAFDLRLTEVQAGSARPQLLLRRPASVDQADFDDYLPSFRAARDVVIEAVSQVSQNAALPPTFPRDRIRDIKRFGLTLKAGERVHMASPGPEGPTADLTVDVRALLTQIDDVLTVNEPDVHTARGVIVEYDGQRRTFRLRSESASPVLICHIPTDDDAAERLARSAKDALAPDGVTAPDVDVEGVGTLDHDGQLRAVSVRRISVTRSWPEKRAMSQIDALRSLSDGWLGPGSVRPPEAIVEIVMEMASAAAAVAPGLLIVPDADGHIVFEWRRDRIEYTAELDSSQMFLCTDNVDTDATDGVEMAFDRVVLLRFLATGDWR